MGLESKIFEVDRYFTWKFNCKQKRWHHNRAINITKALKRIYYCHFFLPFFSSCLSSKEESSTIKPPQSLWCINNSAARKGPFVRARHWKRSVWIFHDVISAWNNLAEMRPDKLCEQNVNHLSSEAMLTAKRGSERNSLLLNNKWRNKLSNLLGIQRAPAVMNVHIKPTVNWRWLWGMIFQSARPLRSRHFKCYS